MALKNEFGRVPPSAIIWKSMGFPCGSVGKESACNVGDLGLKPGLGRSPGLYSPWGCKESTQLSDFQFHFHFSLS